MTKKKRDPAMPLEFGERQLVVLRHICNGLTERQTARRVRRTYNTVHTTVTSIYRKVGVHSKAQLLLWWFSPAANSYRQVDRH